MLNPFTAGVALIVVESGHEFYDDMTDTTHVVSKGNVVFQGLTKAFMVQEDYDAIEARFATQEDRKDG